MGQRTHDPRSVHYKGPAYPFGLKHGKFSNECSPGPCYFPDTRMTRVGKDGTPSYSLHDRPKTAPSFKAPGPGAYAPEKSGQSAHYRFPAYSFGSRNKNRKSDQTPAPNAYSLDPMLGKTTRSGKKQAPCYSMVGKSNQGAFYQDLSKTPGPSAYRVIDPETYKNKGPQYSMTSRNNMPGDGTQKPGPGAHSPEKVYVTKRQPSSFSFGIRHSQYIAPLIVDPVD